MGVVIFRTNHYYYVMSVEILVQAYHLLSAADKTRFFELIESEVLLWPDEVVQSITDEEWQAMEVELTGVREGSVMTISLKEAIAKLR